MRLLLPVLLVTMGVFANAAEVSQEAIYGCIDQLRTVGGPDGQGRAVLLTECAEATSLVKMQDRGETGWRYSAPTRFRHARHRLKQKTRADEWRGFVACQVSDLSLLGPVRSDL